MPTAVARRLAPVAVSILIAAGLWTPPATAAPQRPSTHASAGHAVPTRPLRAKRPPKRTMPRWSPKGRSWPIGGTAVVPVAAAASKRAPSPANVGGLPLTVRKANAVAAPDGVRVSVAGRKEAQAAGVNGVLFTVRPADGATRSGAVAMELSYAGFANAYGGDFGGRLRLVRLPACALSTPSRRQCAAQSPVPGVTNDRTAQMVSAESVPVLKGEPTVYALSGGPSSDAGTYRATTLSPTYSWASGSSGGEFTYDVPLRVPPSLNGPEPDLSFHYSSGSVDGQTTSTNNQTSWVGEGWDLQGGYIERSFKTCGDDGTAADPGDFCWFTQSTANMVLAGHSTRLVRDDSTGRWRGEADDGSRVELLTDGAAWRENGDQTGEYWRVTTVDGTQYHFGLNRRYQGDPQKTDSTQNVLVYGNNPGEPCYDRSSSASGRGCTWTYRWNLDYVVDPSGNSMTYFYEAYVGKYGNWNATQNYAYDITARLARIEYGTRAGSEGSGTAPMRVVFGVTNRCSDFTGSCSVYPDTPWDLVCGVDWQTQCVQTSPTFWTPWRLAAVTTQVWDAGSGEYRNVDGWHLTPEFPSTGSGENPSLWLTHLQHDGEGIGEPYLDFNGALLANRVGAGSGSALNHWRLSQVVNGVGGVTQVNYSDAECTAAIVGSITKNNNPYRCFPDAGSSTWFHKYVVDSVVETDLTGGGPDETWSYDYSTASANTTALWHFDNNEQAPVARRTWADFAGYSDVTTTHGPPGGTRSVTRRVYHRGMDGDYMGSGQNNRFGTVTDSTGLVALDQYPLRGFLREEQDLDDNDDARTRTVHWPTLNLDPDRPAGGTAHREAPWPGGTMTAFMLREYLTMSITWVDATGSWREHRTERAFDDEYGLEVSATDYGDTAVDGDESCTTTTYARNTDSWVVDRTAEVVTTDCDGTTGSHVLAGSRTYYDGGSLGAEPGRGLPTRTEKLASVSGSTRTWKQADRSEYDQYGRVTAAYDALDRRTTTIYRPATGGPLTRTTVINPLGQGTTTTNDPRWGQPSEIVDANGRSTRMRYDALGRLTNVDQPHNTPGGAITGYTVTAGSTPYVAGDTAVALTGDDVHTQINLPFSFRFYGNSYTSAWLSSNGLLSFTDHIADGGSSPIPSSDAPNNALYAFWDDLELTAGSSVRTKTIGTAPNRQFVIDYHNVALYGREGRVSFSITLAETTGAITFNYADISATDPAERGDDATIGVENAAGTAGTVYLDDDPILADNTAVTFTPATAPSTTHSDLEYAYTLSATGPNVVSTKKLGPAGNQIESRELYDGRRRLRQTQAPADQAHPGRIVADTAYDERGLVAERSAFFTTGAVGSTLAAFADSAVSNQHRITYDGLERPVTDGLYARGALEWQTRTGYDGDRTWTIPPAGGTATMRLLDVRGHMTALRQYLTGAPPTGGTFQTTSYTYDRLGRSTSTTDPAGAQWTTTYDLRGRTTQSTDPDSGTTTLGYDDAGRTTTRTDARNVTLAYTYDELGRRTGVYDGSTSGFKRAGWTYDTLAKGRLTSSTRRVTTTEEYTDTVTGYDDQYHPLGSSVQLPAATGQPSGTYTTGLTYNVDGSVATTSYPASGGLAAETVTNDYDTTGHLRSVHGQNTYIASIDYYDFGPIHERVLGGAGKQVRLTQDVDEATGRLTTAATATQNQATPSAWDEKLAERYGYDDAGNVTSIAESGNGTQCFTYDSLQRLTEAWTSSATACPSGPSPAAVGGPDPYWSTYTYNAAGLRNTEKQNTTGVTRTYTYPAGAQRHTLTSAGSDTYGYDAAGNTTARNITGKPGQTLTWDSEEHLSAVTDSAGTSSYVYDADGNRLIARDPAGATAYLAGTELRKSGNAAVTATRFYADVAVREDSGTLTFLSADQHGTAELAVNATTLTATRRRTDPFGRPRGADPAWPTGHGFVDGVRDTATGLTHLGAREYDPATARFLSVDPLTTFDDPGSLGNYTYAGNNPVTSSDPAGTCTDCAAQPAQTKKSKPISWSYSAMRAVAKKLPAKKGLHVKSLIKGIKRIGPGYRMPWLQCDDSVNCRAGQWEKNFNDTLLTRLLSSLAGLPLVACSIPGCSTLGPAQEGWCFLHSGICKQALFAAEYSSKLAERLRQDGTLNSAEQNAFHHMFWMAMMVGVFGISKDDALLLGMAHEVDGTGDNALGSDNSKIDLHNNIVGAELGELIRDNKKSTPEAAVLYMVKNASKFNWFGPYAGQDQP